MRVGTLPIVGPTTPVIPPTVAGARRVAEVARLNAEESGPDERPVGAATRAIGPPVVGGAARILEPLGQVLEAETEATGRQDLRRP